MTAQERNYRAAITATREWCTTRGVDPTPLIVRAVFAWLTESGGLVYANDGAAFHPNPAMRRPGWDRDPDGNPLTAALLEDCYKAVRVSLEYPHDAVGNNGGSTGGVQQLSQDYVAARFPGKTWGYGTIADTMDPALATTMFIDRVTVTGNPVYGGITFSDPLVADVLRVQQPLVSEHQSSNYSPAQVTLARAITAELDTHSDWIDMATAEEVKAAFQDAVNPLFKQIDARLDALDKAVGVAAFDAKAARSNSASAAGRAQEARVAVNAFGTPLQAARGNAASAADRAAKILTDVADLKDLLVAHIDSSNPPADPPPVDPAPVA